MHRRPLFLPALCLLALVAPAAGAAMTLPGISSPTGNIRCLFLGAPSRDLLGLVNCSGGILYDPSTQHPRYSTLPYGRTRRLGSFTCGSRRTGVTCTNGRAHGLFLSRESWRAW